MSTILLRMVYLTKSRFICLEYKNSYLKLVYDMLDLHLEIQKKTAQRLQKIVESYPDSEAFAQNVIAQQIAELKRGNLNLRLDIQDYEDIYKMTSESFYEQFMHGDLDDREAYMIWSGLYEMLLDNEKRLQELA